MLRAATVDVTDNTYEGSSHEEALLRPGARGDVRRRQRRVAYAASLTGTSSTTAGVSAPAVTNTLCIGTSCKAIGFAASSLTVTADAAGSLSGALSRPVITPVYGETAYGVGGSGVGVRVTRPALSGSLSGTVTVAGSLGGNSASWPSVAHRPALGPYCNPKSGQ